MQLLMEKLTLLRSTNQAQVQIESALWWILSDENLTIEQPQVSFLKPFVENCQHICI